MHDCTIKTYRGARRTSYRKAVLHAARADSPAVTAPRGRNGQLMALAASVRRSLRAATDDPLLVPIQDRLRRRLVAIAAEQIRQRHLDTPAGWPDFGKTLVDRKGSLWLISGAGWYEYSKRFGSRYQEAAYLCGRDDGQLFAVRVPAPMRNVWEALEWLKPAAIRDAEARGLPVKRQGDIFFRPVRGLSRHDLGALRSTRHAARPRKDGGLTIVHPEHHPVILAARFRWRAYASTQIASRGRTAAD